MTNVARHLWAQLLLCALVILLPTPGVALLESSQSRSSLQQRDGQHDFDFEFGEWKIQLSRLLRPLTGSTTWVEYEGTSVVRRVWNGRASLGELDVAGSAGQIRGLRPGRSTGRRHSRR